MRRVTLDNIACTYCATPLNDPGVIVTEDHVIGLKLVPKGTLSGQWNLVVQACKDCNQGKCKLEDDLSAISMQPDAWNRPAVANALLVREAARKAHRSISQRTLKTVKNSSEELWLTFPFASGVARFRMEGPPQADPERIHRLAFLQTTAFFYWLTYDRGKRKGYYFPGQFFYIDFAPRTNWGNPIMRAFMDTVIEWDLRLTTIAAHGFFKASIRRHRTAPCWSSAIEWNQNFRIVSLFGEEEVVKSVALTFPERVVSVAPYGTNQYVRYWRETRLADGDDKLFSFSD